jgi:bifunctional polynucleotide phosphatase/kinase
MTSTMKRKATNDYVDTTSRKQTKRNNKGSWMFAGERSMPALMWYQQDTCQSQIAGFDMDHTILQPKSGGKFPQNRSDWEYLDSTKIKTKLLELHKEGYSIVLFTNQAGIEKKKVQAADIRGKIEDLEQDLGIPIHAVVACANDHYRKPSCTMWNLLDKKYGKIDRSKSFYCGDAAGRPKNWKKGAPKDFSSGDRSFALNLGVKFYLPEELFFGQECSNVPFALDGLDPKTILEEENAAPDTATKIKIPGKQEMVILVGWPASGKSSLYRSVFAPKGYVQVNQDSLGSKDKCHREAKRAIDGGKSVVIDNTNPAADDRKPYLTMAKAKKIPVRCIRLGTSRDVAVHNNFFRVKETKGKVRRIPTVAYHTFNKKLEEPNTKEGFDSIETLPFVPYFDTAKKKKLYLERVEKG